MTIRKAILIGLLLIIGSFPLNVSGQDSIESIYLPLVSGSSTSSLAMSDEQQHYLDELYGFALIVPKEWHITKAVSPGDITQIMSADYSIRLEFGVHLKDKPSNVDMETWSNDDEFQKRLLNSIYLMHPNGHTMLRQDFVPIHDQNSSSSRFLIERAGKVFFIFIPDTSVLVKPDISALLNSMEYVKEYTHKQNEVQRLTISARIAATTDNTLSASGISSARYNYRLPLAGNHDISQGPNGTGCSPLSHTGGDSEAIDFSMDIGTPIYAARGGTANLTSSSTGYGNRIEIVHVDGQVSRYAHLRAQNAFAITDGAPVFSGKLIGYSGDTGHSNGPHLHFQVEDPSVSDTHVWIRDLFGMVWISGDPYAPCQPNPNDDGHAFGLPANTLYPSPGCPDDVEGPTDRVILYRDSKCTDILATYTSPGAHLIGDFRSIYVPPAWNVKISDDINFSTSSNLVCTYVSISDLDQYAYSRTWLPLLGRISAIDISNTTICDQLPPIRYQCTNGVASASSNGSCIPDTPPTPPTNPTSTPVPSGQAKLYSQANFGGFVVWSGNTGFSNDPSGNSYSLQLPSGWSAKTWRGDNRAGDPRCWTGSVNNLQDHGWQLAIQSIEVFSYNACPAPTNTPLPSSTNTPQPTATTIAATPTPAGLVKLYSLANYGGSLIWNGNVGFSNEPNANSYSLQIPSGWSAKTWRGDNRTGEDRTWCNSVSNLQDHGWHLAIQSIEVYNFPCSSSGGSSTTLCTDDGATQGCTNYNLGVYQLGGTSLNDAYRSVKSVASGKSIMLYRESGFRGVAECLTGSKIPLTGFEDSNWDLRGQVTDFQVFNSSNCPESELKSLMIYRDSNASGPMAGVGVSAGVYNLGQIGGPVNRNDWLSSIRVPAGKSAYAYMDDNRGGSSSGCLTGTGNLFGSMDRQVSSIWLFDNTSCTPPVPDAPTDFRVTSTSQNIIVLAWNNVVDESGYRIERWNGSSWLAAATLGVDVTTWTQSELGCGTPYSFRLRAYNGTGNSAMVQTSGTTQNCPTPTATHTYTPLPTLTPTHTPTPTPTYTSTPVYPVRPEIPAVIAPQHEAVVATGAIVNLRWQPLSYPVDYLIYVYHNGQMVADSGGLTGSSWDFTFAEAGTYYWTISSLCTGCQEYFSGYSQTYTLYVGGLPTATATVTFTPTQTNSPTLTPTATPTRIAKPAVPVIIAPANGAVLPAGTITFQWQRADGAVYYGIEIWKDGTQFHGTGSTLTAFDYNYSLEPGDYYWLAESYCDPDRCEQTWSGWTENVFFKVVDNSVHIPTATPATPPPTDTSTGTAPPTSTHTPTSTPTPAPLCSVSIGKGLLYTNQRDILIYADVSNAAEVQLSNDGGFGGAVWQPYTPILSWTLSNPPQKVTTLLVYARFRDGRGNILCGSTAVSDDVIYDAEPPTVRIQSFTVSSMQSANAESPQLLTGKLELDASDQQAGSGIARMRVGTTPNLTSVRWQIYQSATDLFLPDSSMLYVQVRDGAGNESAIVGWALAQNKNIYLPLIQR